MSYLQQWMPTELEGLDGSDTSVSPLPTIVVVSYNVNYFLDSAHTNAFKMNHSLLSKINLNYLSQSVPEENPYVCNE